MFLSFSFINAKEKSAYLLMQTSTESKENRQLLYSPQQTLGFPKVRYQPHLKRKLTKVNKPILWNEKTKHKRLT